MGCTSCGEKRAARMRDAVSPEEAARIAASQPRPKYYVTEPDGTKTEFEDYGAATAHRRHTNGTLTTTS